MFGLVKILTKQPSGWDISVVSLFTRNPLGHYHNIIGNKLLAESWLEIENRGGFKYDIYIQFL